MKFFYLLISLFFLSNAYSQKVPAEKTVTIKDSSSSKKSKPDTTAKQKVYSPKVAARRSAIIPGWGQAYNKRYWKIPIIYGALGVAASVFVYNLNNYHDTRYAYTAKYNASQGDSSGLPFIKPELVPLDMSALRTYRDEFRRNIDYSALF